MIDAINWQAVGVVVGIAGGAWAATWGGVKAIVWVTALVASVRRAHERLDDHEGGCEKRHVEVREELASVRSTIEAHRKEAKLDAETTRRELGGRIGDLTKAIIGQRGWQP